MLRVYSPSSLEASLGLAARTYFEAETEVFPSKAEVVTSASFRLFANDIGEGLH